MMINRSPSRVEFLCRFITMNIDPLPYAGEKKTLNSRGESNPKKTRSWLQFDVMHIDFRQKVKMINLLYNANIDIRNINNNNKTIVKLQSKKL